MERSAFDRTHGGTASGLAQSHLKGKQAQSVAVGRGSMEEEALTRLLVVGTYERSYRRLMTHRGGG